MTTAGAGKLQAASCTSKPALRSQRPSRLYHSISQRGYSSHLSLFIILRHDERGLLGLHVNRQLSNHAIATIPAPRHISGGTIPPSDTLVDSTPGR